MRIRQQLGQQLAEQALVAGVGIGMKQANRNGLRRGARKILDEAARVVAVQRSQRTVWAHALRRAEAQLSCNQGCGRRRREPVEVRAALPAELDHVGEALARHERRPRRATLEQGVGRDRHAVGEALDLQRSRAAAVEHEPDGLDDAGGLVVGRRGHLGRVDGCVAVDEDCIGEGAADIDPEEHVGSLRDGRPAVGAISGVPAPARAAREGRLSGALQAASSSRFSVSARC